MSTLPALNTALRAHARGHYADEAGVELLISHKTLLQRSGFRDRYIHLATSTTDGITRMATIQWPAVLAALDTGDLPCSSGEQRILRIAASLANGTPVNLRDCLTGLDHDNTHRVTNALLHASGHRPSTDTP
jgi:hypothetical protein